MPARELRREDRLFHAGAARSTRPACESGWLSPSQRPVDWVMIRLSCESLMEKPTMAADNASELVVFHRFLGDQIAIGSVELSPEESVEAFRAYQRDLERLRHDLEPAIGRFERGEPAIPLDIEDVKRRGRERLAREGIV